MKPLKIGKSGNDIAKKPAIAKQNDLNLNLEAHKLLLNAEIGKILTSANMLDRKLQLSTEALVHHLDAAFARIWVLNVPEDILVLKASAGMYTHLDGEHSHVKVGELKIGKIAKEQKPHLTNNVIGDKRVNHQDWAKRMGMQSFAGYPLMVDGNIVGVMALFSKQELTKSTLDILASIADEIALGISHADAEKKLQLEKQRLRGLLMDAPAMIAIVTGPDHVYELANPLYLKVSRKD